MKVGSGLVGSAVSRIGTGFGLGFALTGAGVAGCAAPGIGGAEAGRADSSDPAPMGAAESGSKAGACAKAAGVSADVSSAASEKAETRRLMTKTHPARGGDPRDNCNRLSMVHEIHTNSIAETSDREPGVENIHREKLNSP